MWGETPTFLRAFPDPRGRQDLKNAPNKFGQTAFRYPVDVPIIVSYRLETPSMSKALKLPLEQTRFAGKSNWVRCDAVLTVWSRRPANEPPNLSLQTRFVWPQTDRFGGQVSKVSGL